MFRKENMNFIAEVQQIWDKTRFQDSGFMCSIIQGGIHKGDMVQFLDHDGDFIAEQELKAISHSQKLFETVKKGDAKDDTVVLEFKNIWEYPIQNTKYIVEMNEAAQYEYKHKPPVTLPINNERSYRQSITKEIDIEAFTKKFYIYPLSRNPGFYFVDVYRGPGVECLRETNLGALYSVHKVKQGGLLYIFYARLANSPYVKVAGWYYVQKKLSSEDLKDIKKGSALQDIVAIDPAARIYQNVYDSNPFLFNLKGIGLDTYHFLDDGIIKFHFAYTVESGEEGQLRVTKKQFADFHDIQSIQPGSRIVSLDGHIFPMDRID